jgi:hypothetical protein
MTPISRLFSNLLDLVTGTFYTFLGMFEKMDGVQMATFSICVLVIGAMCLRGNPVRGA